MVRHFEVVYEAVDPIEGLFLMCFAILALGALLHCMARTKRVGSDSSQPEEPSSRKRGGEESSGDPNDKGKRPKMRHGSN